MKPTIIFDLGGVIIPLNTEATINKIQEYTNKDIREWIKFGYPHQLIQKFELGKISEKEFFEELSDLLEFEGELYYLKEAWNAMLLPVPKENISYLLKLKEHFQLIILSNTCETHIQKFEEMLKKNHSIDSFESLVDSVYYSCRIGLRKPDLKVFQKIISENSIDLNSCIYFDDTTTHIEAAQKLNIHSILYPHNEILSNVVKNYLITQNQL
ncbi:MAG TPA: HAD family phosphatase [Bacteroidia bacterium]|nr:HAD family phosphatase [Bacteroidia bacterium]